MNWSTTTFPANWLSVKFFPVLASIRVAVFHAEFVTWRGRADEPAAVCDREYAPITITMRTNPSMAEFLFQ